jgi:zinc transport system permease protein
MLQHADMQRAMLAAVLVGLTAPTVGVHLVQRRLALIGDGLGHVALAGAAAGVLTRHEPVFTALLFASIGAVAIELMRYRGRTSGDVALAIMFYGGIASGVVIVSRAPEGAPSDLDGYLFGAITTTTRGDVITFAVLSVAVVAVTLGLGRYLFAVGHDEEYARASGLPVLGLNIALAVVTAVTIVVSMRVIGLLLISALMIVPVATAQLVARSFRTATIVAVGLGLVEAVVGVWIAYETDSPSGGAVVLTAIGAFLLLASVQGLRSVRRGRLSRPSG